MIRLFFLLIMLLGLAACGNVMNDITPEDIEERLTRLDSATPWVIENGISFENKYGFENFYKEVSSNFRVGIRGNGLVKNSKGSFIDIPLTVSVVGHIVRGLYREEVDGKYYEFWSRQETGERWTEVNANYHFYITEAEDELGIRKIIYDSPNFIETYALSNGQTIKFPVTDKYKLYDLRPWDYPDAFVGSSLESIKKQNVDEYPE